MIQVSTIPKCRVEIALTHSSGLPILPQASSSKTPLESLQSLLASVPHPSRPALMSHILNALLTAVSTYLPNISHLLIGETSTRQAERIISATASGRGWALPLELATTLKLDNGVKRISPMKDLSYKEAAFSCRIRRLETRNYRGWDRTKVGASSDKREARGKGGAMSIEGLTEREFKWAIGRVGKLIRMCQNSSRCSVPHILLLYLR